MRRVGSYVHFVVEARLPYLESPRRQGSYSLTRPDILRRHDVRLMRRLQVLYWFMTTRLGIAAAAQYDVIAKHASFSNVPPRQPRKPRWVPVEVRYAGLRR